MLKHPWVTGENTPAEPLPRPHRERVQEFQAGSRRLRSGALMPALRKRRNSAEVLEAPTIILPPSTDDEVEVSGSG